MNRQAQAVVLLLVGGVVLRTSFTNAYRNYVGEGLRPYLIAAGVALLATAAATLWYELRAPAAADPHGHSADDGHGPGHGADDGHGHGGEPRVAWLLLLPVIALLLIAPPARGSYAASRSGTALGQQKQPSDFPPLPDGDPAHISVLDYASRSVFDNGESMIDGSTPPGAPTRYRRVQLTGFIVIGPDGAPYLARMIVTCCAADARPIKIGLAGKVPKGLTPDTWLEVTGQYNNRIVKDKVNDDKIPFIEVIEAREIAAPSRPYET